MSTSDDDVYAPTSEDDDPELSSVMSLGQGEDNDLRDPYLMTEEGHAWLRDHGAENEIDDHR